MGTRMRHYKKSLIPLIFLMLAPLAASAQVPQLTPLNYATRYDVTLGGMAVGRVRITTTEDAFGYRMVVDTKSRGLVDMFAPLQSVAIVSGKRIGDRYVPSLYTSNANKDGDAKDGRVELAYDEQGRIVKRIRVPDDDPKWRPPVPREQTNASTDPMTAVFILRQSLRDAMARNQREVSVMGYDGARLAKFTLKVVSRARIEVRGKYVDAINTVMTREPINGYTPKELKKFKAGDPVMHVYFSADDKMLPLMATMSLFYGEIRAVLTEQKPAKK